jgi:hypothetical protein
MLSRSQLAIYRHMLSLTLQLRCCSSMVLVIIALVRAATCTEMTAVSFRFPLAIQVSLSQLFNNTVNVGAL